MKRKIVIGFLILSFVIPAQGFSQASPNSNQFAYGVQRTLLAPFQIPLRTFQGTMYGPPIFGTVSGVLTGAVLTVTDLAGGLFDMVGAAAPLAKYGLFFL